MRDFSSLLEFSFWTLEEFCVGRHGVVVPRTRERTAKFRDLSGRLVDTDDITCQYLFLGERIDHFVSEVIYCIHIGRFDSQFSSLRSLKI